jgi:cytochrome c oxidase assembly factor CtaG
MSAVVVFLAIWYLFGWLRLRSTSANAVQPWRAASVLVGLFLVWIALDSPLVAYDHHLLTVHMIQHLLLMTVAPALILLGQPFLALWHGSSRPGRVMLDRFVQRPFAQRFTPIRSWPVVCWSVSALTLLAWHVPALFAFGMSSRAWHSLEQSSFVVGGLLFWSPVVQPWPSESSGPQWTTLLYLFFATLPCDILSGFLVFSDRVVYAAYLSMPRHFGLSALEDQQCAAALMWTCVTLVYLLPAAFLSTRLLSPRGVRVPIDKVELASGIGCD